MLAALDAAGNPASVHAAGRAARRILEDAREAIAARFGGAPGGPRVHLRRHRGRCAGDPRARAPAAADRDRRDRARRDPRRRARTPPSCRWTATASPISPRSRRSWPTAPPALVCLMLANNETGTIQPVAEAAALCRRHGALLHVDAVQAAGRMPVDLAALGAHCPRALLAQARRPDGRRRAAARPRSAPARR